MRQGIEARGLSANGNEEGETVMTKDYSGRIVPTEELKQDNDDLKTQLEKNETRLLEALDRWLVVLNRRNKTKGVGDNGTR